MFGTIGTTVVHAAALRGEVQGWRGRAPPPPTRIRPAIVEVEVDVSSGWIHVPRVWIAHDIGRALNPTLVRGQVERQVYMAIARR
jgi:hypothetical protein